MDWTFNVAQVQELEEIRIARDLPHFEEDEQEKRLMGEWAK